MGAGKVVLLGAVVVGGVLALMHHANAAPSSSSSGTPPPTPGPGATSSVTPSPLAINGLTSIRHTLWHVAADASGQQPGQFVLTQNANNANDWVLSFKADNGGGAGVMAYGSTPMSGLLAQAIAAGQ